MSPNVTSDQHKDTSKATQDHDMKDTKKILDYRIDKNPFSDTELSLHSIASGVTATNKVNVDEGKNIRENILKSVEGHNVFEYSFKKKDQAVSLVQTNQLILGVRLCKLILSCYFHVL